MAVEDAKFSLQCRSKDLADCGLAATRLANKQHRFLMLQASSNQGVEALHALCPYDLTYSCKVLTSIFIARRSSEECLLKLRGFFTTIYIVRLHVYFEVCLEDLLNKV